jgi:multidrug transporter EmrE-like cation transporter
MGPAALSDSYLFYTFAVAFVLCTVLVLVKKEKPGLRELLYGSLIGIPNFFSAKFLLEALTKLPAVVVYPSFSVATMLIVTLAGVAVFRERLSKQQWIALAAIIIALVFLNV